MTHESKIGVYLFLALVDSIGGASIVNWQSLFRIAMGNSERATEHRGLDRVNLNSSVGSPKCTPPLASVKKCSSPDR